MNFSKFNRQALSDAFSFYARALNYPYDEQRHEFQNIFRTIEKNIENEYDNTLATRILDILNTYQGEEMKELQTEYTRLFTPRGETKPSISLRLGDWLPDGDLAALEERLYDVGVSVYSSEYPDFISHVLEYFASILPYEDETWIEDFFRKYLEKPIPLLTQKIYKESNLNFYKEYAKGLHDLIQLIGEALESDEDSLDNEIFNGPLSD
jgi:nitrate reductase assembly molybdenum cofactor insertion protein NarJ